jgi:broad specificity phosphatase PhoE
MRRKPEREYAQAIAERDEAVAERDFVLKFVEELGAALANADAVAVVTHIHTLRAMFAVAAQI